MESVGDGGVEDCAEDGGGVDACRVVVLLDGCVASGGHPEGHYVVAEGLDAEGVDLFFLLLDLWVRKGEGCLALGRWKGW